tara:strand:- start:137 stop:1297 length:1161 start_codon:yes stop_codon:yes gene_type:complete
MKSKYSELNDWELGSTLQREVEQMELTLKKSKRSPYYYTDFYINNERVNHSTKETNKRKALAIAKEIWVNQKAKKLRPQTLGTMTISQAIDEYLYYKDTLNETDRYHLERIRKELGEKPIGLLTKKDLKNLQQKYKKELTNKGEPLTNISINRRFNSFNALLEIAEEEDWIEFKPKLKKLTEYPGKKRNPYTTKEIEKLILGCYSTNNTHLIDPILFYMNTGFRKKELVRLKREDVKDGGAVVVLKIVKDKKIINQEVYLNRQAQKIVKKNLTEPWNDVETEYLFAGKSRLTGGLGDFKTAWTKIRKKAGLLHKDVHTLRHTASTTVGKRTEGSKEWRTKKIKGFTRHKSNRAIQRYLHLNENDKKDTAELATFDATFGVTFGVTQ